LNSSKKIIGLLMAIMFVLMITVLRGGHGDDMTPAVKKTEQPASLIKSLDLTAEQKQNVLPILESYIDHLNGINDKYRMEGLKALSLIRDERDALQKETIEQLKGLLTKHQQEKCREFFIEENKTISISIPHQSLRPGADEQANKIISALQEACPDLDKKQIDQLRLEITEYFKNLRSIFKKSRDTGMSHGRSPESEMQQTRENMEKNLTGVLSDTQLQELKRILDNLRIEMKENMKKERGFAEKSMHGQM
jgi:hypothetical protein